jgi:hypothetical protein
MSQSTIVNNNTPTNSPTIESLTIESLAIESPTIESTEVPVITLQEPPMVNNIWQERRNEYNRVNQIDETKERINSNQGPREYNNQRPREYNNQRPREYNQGPREYNQGPRPREYNNARPREYNQGPREYNNQGPRPREYNNARPIEHNNPRPRENNQGPREYNNARPMGKIELTQEQKDAREKKNYALNIARSNMTDECMNAVKNVPELFSTDYVDFYMNVIVDVSNNIVIEHANEKYQFSKQQFMENKTFQYKLREQINILNPQKEQQIWVKCFQGRQEGTYCISLSRKR